MFKLLSLIPPDKRESFGDAAGTGGTFAVLMGFLFIVGALDEDELAGMERVGAFALGIVLVIASLICLLAKLKLASMRGDGHLSKYTAILTGVESLSIREISDIAGTKPEIVRREIQSMIDGDVISDFYIDYKSDSVVSKKYVPKTSHKTVVVCPGCGHSSDLIVGITKHCVSCGRALPLRSF